MSGYPGLYGVLATLADALAVVVYALADLPVGATDFAGLAPLLLPYPPAPFRWYQGGGRALGDPWGTLEGAVTLVHPPGAGPLTVKALAAVYPPGGPYLLAVGALEQPATSTTPGETLELPLTLVVTSPQGVS